MTVSSTFVSADGDGYEFQMGRWSRRLAPLFINFAGITAAGCILDVGCGTGSLSFHLAQNHKIGSVRGVDLSSVYIEHAKRHNSDARLDFQVANACALPFPDAAFDHSLSMLVLQFIPQPELAARELRRVTRPGGRWRQQHGIRAEGSSPFGCSGTPPPCSTQLQMSAAPNPALDR